MWCRRLELQGHCDVGRRGIHQEQLGVVERHGKGHLAADQRGVHLALSERQGESGRSDHALLGS